MDRGYSVEELAARSRVAAAGLARLTTGVKDGALRAMADRLERSEEEILGENAVDLEEGRRRELGTALMDRLALDGGRIREMAEGLREVAASRDPVGEVVDGWRLPNGLAVERVRVPLGVVGIIYEARPNVTVDAAGLCIKSGNSVILRGSSSAISSNRVLARLLAEAGREAGLPDDCVLLVDSADRESARRLMRARGLVDVLIPRGGAGLISTVVENSTVPVIETGVGNCHVYVDASADEEMAARIVVNAKTQRPGVCNACETLLVHESVAGSFLPLVAGLLFEKGVELRGDERTRGLVQGVVPASEDDWSAEYLDLVIAVRVVDGLDEAIEHINRYGSGHSEAIVTRDYERGERFLREVDSAAVYVNASTRFTDGAQFGLGAEIGISTQKLHARGPMSLRDLTTTRFMVRGSGQVRD